MNENYDVNGNWDPANSYGVKPDWNLNNNYGTDTNDYVVQSDGTASNDYGAQPDLTTTNDYGTTTVSDYGTVPNWGANNEYVVENDWLQNDKRNQMIDRFNMMRNAESVQKAMNATACMQRIVGCIVQIVFFFIICTKLASTNGLQSTYVKLFFLIFIVVGLCDVAILIKEVLILINIPKIKNEVFISVDQFEIPDIEEQGKKLRKTILVCDILSKLSPLLIAVILGGMFVVVGIKLGISTQAAMQRIMYITLFPLMGIVAILAAATPVVRSIKELKNIDHVIWYEMEKPMPQKQKSSPLKNLTMKQLQIVGFGAIFFLCGFFAIISGIHFIPEGSMGQFAGMFFIGLIFAGIGALIIWLGINRPNDFH